MILHTSYNKMPYWESHANERHANERRVLLQWDVKGGKWICGEREAKERLQITAQSQGGCDPQILLDSWWEGASFPCCTQCGALGETARKGEGKGGKEALQSCPDLLAFILSLETVAEAVERLWLIRRNERAALLFTCWAGQVITLLLVLAGKQLSFCSWTLQESF